MGLYIPLNENKPRDPHDLSLARACHPSRQSQRKREKVCLEFQSSTASSSASFIKNMRRPIFMLCMQNTKPQSGLTPFEFWKDIYRAGCYRWFLNRRRCINPSYDITGNRHVKESPSSAFHHRIKRGARS